MPGMNPGRTLFFHVKMAVPFPFGMRGFPNKNQGMKKNQANPSCPDEMRCTGRFLPGKIIICPLEQRKCV